MMRERQRPGTAPRWRCRLIGKPLDFDSCDLGSSPSAASNPYFAPLPFLIDAAIVSSLARDAADDPK